MATAAPIRAPVLGKHGSKNPFAAVRLATMPARLRAQLPNGVMLEPAIGAGDSATLAAAINVLAKLPCSG